MATNFGDFSIPSYTTIGDPYKNPEEPKVHYIENTKQFLTNSPQKGQTGSNWGPGSRKFIGITGSNQEPYKIEAQNRLENTKKYIKPNGFVYSNPAKKSMGSGDYYGTFGGQAIGKNQELSNKIPLETKIKSKIIKDSKLEKNIVTTGSKKGTYGYVGTLLGGEIKALDADYDSFRRENKKQFEYHKKIIGEKKAFRISGNDNGKSFDSQEHCDASKIFTWDDTCKIKQQNPFELMNPKEKIESMKDEIKSWKPNHVTKSGKDGTFTPFPEQLPDRYDENIINHAMLPNRRNPVNVAMKDLPVSLKERKPFKPSNGNKSKATKGTCLLGLNKRNV